MTVIQPQRKGEKPCPFCDRSPVVHDDPMGYGVIARCVNSLCVAMPYVTGGSKKDAVEKWRELKVIRIHQSLTYCLIAEIGDDGICTRASIKDMVGDPAYRIWTQCKNKGWRPVFVGEPKWALDIIFGNTEAE